MAAIKAQSGLPSSPNPIMSLCGQTARPTHKGLMTATTDTGTACCSNTDTGTVCCSNGRLRPPCLCCTDADSTELDQREWEEDEEEEEEEEEEAKKKKKKKKKRRRRRRKITTKNNNKTHNNKTQLSVLTKNLKHLLSGNELK